MYYSKFWAPTWIKLSFKRRVEFQSEVETAAPRSPSPKFLPEVFFQESS